jgi:8-oxo-dGTP diphosphatase
MEIKKFNLRVYAIVIRDGHILLADERINDYSFTKFPGGGVELGEGLADALKRELMEEGQLEIESMEHVYTTDFFQPSAFDPSDQIISVYYRVKAFIPWNEFSSDQSSPGKKHHVRLYFAPLADLRSGHLTFPIDRHVLSLLL